VAADNVPDWCRTTFAARSASWRLVRTLELGGSGADRIAPVTMTAPTIRNPPATSQNPRFEGGFEEEVEEELTAVKWVSSTARD
jgi:hypothetical protein